MTFLSNLLNRYHLGRPFLGMGMVHCDSDHMSSALNANMNTNKLNTYTASLHPVSKRRRQRKEKFTDFVMMVKLVTSQKHKDSLVMAF